MSDYRIVADLVEPILSSANGAAISDEMRHTVTVVGELTRYAENHLGAIAQKLGVDHSTASRRCRAALEAGYMEKRKYPRTNRIEYRPGMPLPTAEARVLPTVEELEKA